MIQLDSIRSSTDARLHSSNASDAARTAASTWSGLAAATAPSRSPVAGLVTSISSPSPRRHSPPMNGPVVVSIALVANVPSSFLPAG
jgi:hypothetical protein